MTLLARSDKNKGGYKGLSMFLVPKSPGKDNVDFPDKGIKGGEIEVLGYKSMKSVSMILELIKRIYSERKKEKGLHSLWKLLRARESKQQQERLV